MAYFMIGVYLAGFSIGAIFAVLVIACEKIRKGRE